MPKYVCPTFLSHPHLAPRLRMSRAIPLFVLFASYDVCPQI